ncbi:MAG: hypothetical protein ACOX4H_08255 [Bacillota bacterium]|jgi:hypothetical protein|nr:hypothetical protein [Clostridia bacterium]
MKENNNYHDTISQLIAFLKPMSESYRLLVGAADEFNKITLAHKKDLEDAINRADDLGDIIDKLIKTLDRLLEKELHRIKKEGLEEKPDESKIPKGITL